MIKDIMVMVVKEFNDYEKSIKKFLILLFFMFPILVAVISKFSHSLLSLDISVIYIYLLVPILVTMQIVYDSIISEKKSKTFDILLSSGISKSAIIIGKAIPACLISYIFSIISLVVLKFGLANIISIEITIFMFIIPIFISYFASCITMILSILVSDDKVAPMINAICSTAIVFGGFYCIYTFGMALINTYLWLLILIFIFLSVVLTILLSYILQSNKIISKL